MGKKKTYFFLGKKENISDTRLWIKDNNYEKILADLWKNKKDKIPVKQAILSIDSLDDIYFSDIAIQLEEIKKDMWISLYVFRIAAA